jgi:hypothetical protein
MRAKASANEVAHDASRQLKEKLAAQDQELADAVQEAQRLKDAQARIATAVKQLVAVNKPDGSQTKARGSPTPRSIGKYDVEKALQQCKAQQLCMWHDLELLKKVSAHFLLPPSFNFHWRPLGECICASSRHCLVTSMMP